MKLETRLWIIVGIIFSIFVCLILLSGCKKDDPQPIEATNTVKTASKLSVVPLQTTCKLFINDVEQININETFIVYTGDKITVTDKGSDSTILGSGGAILGKSEGKTGAKIIIDNVIVFEEYCNCDTYYIKTI